jgi:4-hydroxyproline epimerase
MRRHTFLCIDAHTCGNPVRVVAAGAPALANLPMAERREVFIRDHDWVRRALMFEPRGHDVMSGVILYPPSREDCDIGFLFIEVSGCLPMCGHGTIGTVTAVLEEGLVTPRTPGRLAIEAPAGRIEVEYTSDGAYVEQVRIHNVASYLHAADVPISVAGLGTLTVDLAYGGNYYCIVEPQPNWGGLDTITAAEIIALSPAVRDAAQQELAPVHPEDSRIRGVSHVMWCDGPRHPRANARNAVFYGERAIDRSPCGTGSSARMAQLAARGRLHVGDDFVHESLIGTLFDCHIDSATRVGDFDAIHPSIAGWARVIGHNTIFVDERDPLAHGFQVL